jgi:protein O-GlcNAc transferase
MSSNETAEENFFKGLACFDANDFAKAESFFVRTLELAPGHIATLNNLAAAQYGQGKTGEAAITAANILKIDERNLGAYGMLSNCQMAQEDYPAALATCRTIIAIDPTVAEPYCKSGYILNLAGKYQEAVESCDRALKLQPQFVEALLCRGNALRNLNRHDEAIAAYSEALSLKPDLLQAWLSRGDSLADLDRHDEAIAAYDKALLLDSDLPVAWLGRGNVLGNLRRYGEAIEAYDRALSKSDLAPAWLGRGNVLSMLGRYEEAIEAYDRALSQSDMAPAWLGRGNVLSMLRRHEEAVAAYDKALALNSDLAAAWLGSGNALSELERHDEAMAAYDKALALNPDLPAAWLGRGDILAIRKHHDEALAAYQKVLLLNPELAAAWLGCGYMLAALARHDEALAAFERALTLRPDSADAWIGRADLLAELKRYDDALVAYDKALLLKPELADVWNNRANLLTVLGRYDEAIASYDGAISLNPDLQAGWLGRGNALKMLKRHDEALAANDKALALDPELAEAWSGRGRALGGLERNGEAFAAFDKALALEPGLISAHLARGNLLLLLDRRDEALVDFDAVLSAKPDLAEAWFSRAAVLFLRRHFDEAFFAYNKAFSLSPDLDDTEGQRLHAKMWICQWDNLDEECQSLISSIRSHKANATPFGFLAVSHSSEDQMTCAESWISKSCPASAAAWRGERYDHDRLRVAYLSADFGDHPVSYLMAGVFEQHDRERFETIAVSLGPDNAGEMRQRLRAAFDRFIDVGSQSNEEIASLLRTLEVDIVVDLMGYTAGARTAILANRPAPIQVNYLGYPGTMGAGFMDYLIADPTLIPPAQQKDYVEKIAYLPDSYLPNDDLKRTISDRVFERAEFGLPEHGFVFCCFNNSYKLTPGVFDCWARILKAVEGSVLWLSAVNPPAMSNLKKEISARGVNPDRLVFARQLALSADHLARLRVAGLFLDTLPYNAHTTASDALWAGLPVLTQIGETFAGRVAASLLNALGLTELITHSQGEYEKTAIDLATNPARLALIKDKLARNRMSAPLFNTKAFTRNIEAVYTAMHQRYQAGLAPDHILVPD